MLVLRLGVPEETLARADAYEPDYWGLASALDGVFVVGGGSAGQRYFLSEPHAELGGSTATQVIAEPGGVDLVQRLAKAWTKRHRLSPARVGEVLPSKSRDFFDF